KHDASLYVCRQCDITKKLHPSSVLSAVESCLLCGQSIKHEIQFDESKFVGLNLIDRAARVCQLHATREQMLSRLVQTHSTFLLPCYSCERKFMAQTMVALKCCNLCRMNGNSCIEFNV
uniref:Uncharacterized protein n=1 Tax=Clytia hemisphaerica TaxID=252671 RepID=A0A7M5V1L1_9CNID